MDRRSLLLSLAGLGVAPLVNRSSPDHTPVHSPATPDDWREIAWEYGFTYLSAPRAQLLADLTADLESVMTAMAQARSEAIRTDLAESAGRIAGLAASCCVDLGYWREARHTWRLARRLADQSGSVDTQLWVRGREAILGLYSGRPLPILLNLAEQGLARVKPGAPNAGAAELSAARAQTLALLGRRNEALSALHETEEIFESLPASETDRPTRSLPGPSKACTTRRASFTRTSATLPTQTRCTTVPCPHTPRVRRVAEHRSISTAQSALLAAATSSKLSTTPPAFSNLYPARTADTWCSLSPIWFCRLSQPRNSGGHT